MYFSSPYYKTSPLNLTALNLEQELKISIKQTLIKVAIVINKVLYELYTKPK